MLGGRFYLQTLQIREYVESDTGYGGWEIPSPRDRAGQTVHTPFLRRTHLFFLDGAHHPFSYLALARGDGIRKLQEA